MQNEFQQEQEEEEHVNSQSPFLGRAASNPQFVERVYSLAKMETLMDRAAFIKKKQRVHWISEESSNLDSDAVADDSLPQNCIESEDDSINLSDDVDANLPKKFASKISWNCDMNNTIEQQQTTSFSNDENFHYGNEFVKDNTWTNIGLQCYKEGTFFEDFDRADNKVAIDDFVSRTITNIFFKFNSNII